MAIFLICARSTNPELESKIDQLLPGENFRFSETVWVVNSTKTARQLCEMLGVRKGGLTGVFAMQGTPSYYGVANSALWDWLRSAIERSTDG